jgi:hypothetical protein
MAEKEIVIGESKKAVTQAKKFKKWHIRSFLDGVSNTIAECGIKVPEELLNSVGSGAGALFTRMYEIATRNNTENPKIFCPKCKQFREVELEAHCPAHPNEPAQPVLVDNIKAEQNSMAVAMKIFDKFLPTLASVQNTINVQGTITTVSAHLTQIIFRYVPPTDRRKCFEDIDELLRQVQSEDGD